jgi:hypothetical protein
MVDGTEILAGDRQRKRPEQDEIIKNLFLDFVELLQNLLLTV